MSDNINEHIKNFLNAMKVGNQLHSLEEFIYFKKKGYSLFLSNNIRRKTYDGNIQESALGNDPSSPLKRKSVNNNILSDFTILDT